MECPTLLRYSGKETKRKIYEGNLSQLRVDYTKIEGLERTIGSGTVDGLTKGTRSLDYTGCDLRSRY